MFQCLLLFHSTVCSCHNMVSIIQNIHNRHPIACLWGQAMGCLLWVQCMTMLYHWNCCGVSSIMLQLTILWSGIIVCFDWPCGIFEPLDDTISRTFWGVIYLNFLSASRGENNRICFSVYCYFIVQYVPVITWSVLSRIFTIDTP